VNLWSCIFALWLNSATALISFTVLEVASIRRISRYLDRQFSSNTRPEYLAVHGMSPGIPLACTRNQLRDHRLPLQGARNHQNSRACLSRRNRSKRRGPSGCRMTDQRHRRSWYHQISISTANDRKNTPFGNLPSLPVSLRRGRFQHQTRFTMPLPLQLANRQAGSACGCLRFRPRA
jgi:hypothetical protein